MRSLAVSRAWTIADPSQPSRGEDEGRWLAPGGWTSASSARSTSRQREVAVVVPRTTGNDRASGTARLHAVDAAARKGEEGSGGFRQLHRHHAGGQTDHPTACLPSMVLGRVVASHTASVCLSWCLAPPQIGKVVLARLSAAICQSRRQRRKTEPVVGVSGGQSWGRSR